MPRNIYRLNDGTIVQGTTTICNQLDKPGLLDWAWRCGVNGTDWREERDSAGDIGTNVHDMILRYLKGEEVDTVAGKNLPAGQHQLDLDGNALENGTYLLHLEGSGFRETREIIKVQE